MANADVAVENTRRRINKNEDSHREAVDVRIIRPIEKVFSTHTQTHTQHIIKNMYV